MKINSKKNEKKKYKTGIKLKKNYKNLDKKNKRKKPNEVDERAASISRFLWIFSGKFGIESTPITMEELLDCTGERVPSMGEAIGKAIGVSSVLNTYGG